MNVDDLRSNLRELQKKQKDNQKLRKSVIHELKNTYNRPMSKKIKGDEKEKKKVTILIIQLTFNMDLEGAKEERAEKQKQLDQKESQDLKERNKRILNTSFSRYLQKAKQDLAGQKDRLDKQMEINKRLDDKDKKEIQELKEDKDKRQEQLRQRKQQLEKELAGDEYRRQTLLVDLQIKTMSEYFITRAYPHILWKPCKVNESMNPFKEYSAQRMEGMEKDLRDKLNLAYQQFIDFQQQKQPEKVEPEHETTPSDSEESHQKDGQE